MFKKMTQKIAGSKLALVGTLAGASATTFAEGSPTITLPVDVAGYTTSAGTVMAGIVGAVFGIAISFAIVKLGFKKSTGAVDGKVK